MYRELLITGKLADHCEHIETLAFQFSEQIHHFYISQHSLPEDDFWTRVSAYSTAQMIADEVYEELESKLCTEIYLQG